MFTSLTNKSATLPVIPMLLKSTSTIWLSVPPLTILIPRSLSVLANTFALLIIFCEYSLKSGFNASPKATAFAAITCSNGPPCIPGKTALSNLFPNSLSLHKIKPPLGPLKVL